MNCPKCGGSDILPITYGPPPVTGERLNKALEEKTIILGGCVFCGETPAYACRSCGHRFDAPKKKRRSLFGKT